MIKEIGSIFPLSQESVACGEQNSCLQTMGGNILYSLCREALYDIAVTLRDTCKRVLIPAYTCQTVIAPFEQAGWTCHYYSIQKDLRIDEAHLKNLSRQIDPSLLVVHPYFGMDLNASEIQLLEQIREEGIKIVVDLTQCIFSNQNLPFVDYYVGSYRKWFPIPDGGFLKEKNGSSQISVPKSENKDFVTPQIDAMYLRYLYFQSENQKVKYVSIRLNKLAEGIAEKNICPHRMSKVSCILKQKEEENLIQQKRFSNFTYLFQHLKETEKFAFVCADLNEVTTSPLYFTIYVSNRRFLQCQLAEKGIYAPVIWPVEDEGVLISEDVRYIYNHLLAIPCDQRYDEKDMQRIVDAINLYR